VVSAGLGNSPDKLRHTRSVAYSVELVLLNKQQQTRGGIYSVAQKVSHYQIVKKLR